MVATVNDLSPITSAMRTSANVSVLAPLKGALAPGETHLTFDLHKFFSFQAKVVGLFFLKQNSDGSYSAEADNTFVPVMLPPDFALSGNASVENMVMQVLDYSLLKGDDKLAHQVFWWLEDSQVRASPAVEELARSSDYSKRGDAFDLLTMRHQIDSADPIVETIAAAKDHGESLRLQQWLYSMLVSAPAPKQTRAQFLHLVAATSDPLTQKYAAQALRQWQMPESIPVMRILLDRGDDETKYHIIMGLYELFQLSDNTMGTTFALFLKDPNPYVERWEKFLAENYPRRLLIFGKDGKPVGELKAPTVSSDGNPLDAKEKAQIDALANTLAEGDRQAKILWLCLFYVNERKDSAKAFTLLGNLKDRGAIYDVRMTAIFNNDALSTKEKIAGLEGLLSEFPEQSDHLHALIKMLSGESVAAK